MDLWFLTNQKLLTREREAIFALQEKAEWLVGVEWRLCVGSKLCANVVVRAHNHDYELRLIYPTWGIAEITRKIGTLV